MTRAYHSDLRAQQTELTRERILQATHELLRTRRPADLTYAEVAELSGVSLRTVYRHFPTTDDLLLGVSDLVLSRLGPLDLSTLESGIRLLRAQWHMFEEDPAVFRVWFSVPTRSRGEGNQAIRALFADRVGHLSPAEREHAFALVDLLTCPYAWDVLTRNWGLSADEALAASLGAVDRLFPPVEPR